ncbi:hypothetical protein [Kitasatospora sp. NPDC097643]|uniref:hypothetical protein n=1 Tax=Kitasatospora sp. NPDC097643 TaxID=3157230 RepID=UPI00332116E4
MINTGERADRSWWALVRRTTAASWWQLLLVHTAVAGAFLGLEKLSTQLLRSGELSGAHLLTVVAGGLVTAWGWSVSLRILDGGGLLRALRPAPLRLGRLWCWLVALNISGLTVVVVMSDLTTYSTFLISPEMKAIQLLTLYLAFAGALLPMAVLLEGRGIVRGLRLSHGGWRTVLRVLPVLLLGWIVSGVMNERETLALVVYPRPTGIVAEQVERFLVEVGQGALTAILLYAAYRLAAPKPNPNPATHDDHHPEYMDHVG